ncbi:MAG: serine/threonine-protein phosphatase [Prevotella sp.]|nr:serine/threonine-protein phosphatase [Prevotella sp.]
MIVTEYTNKGSRQENQDYVLHEMLENNHAIFVVADGMGGYSHGDVASHLVAETIVDSVSAHYQEEADISRLMADAYDYANDSLAIKRIALGGCEMGSVVVSAFYDGHAAHITWLGDSRCYLFRNGKQVYCTQDHSILSQLRKIKTLRGYDEDRYASIVTRCVMGDDKLGKIETFKLELIPGDILILCTDGFHKELDVRILLDEKKSKSSKLDSLSESMNDNFSFLKIVV